MTDENLDSLLAGLAANNPESAEAIVQQNYEKIVRVVRRRIGNRFKAKIDEESVAQSAMKSLFEALKLPDIAINDQQDLWNLLNCIALRKLANRIRRFQAGRRSVDREVGMDDLNEMKIEHAAEGPEAEVIIGDLLEHLLEGYGDVERRVVEMSLFGHSVAEIAEDVNYSERMVIRVRTNFRKRLETECARDES